MINIEKYLATSPKIEQKDATSYATPAMPERKFGIHNSFMTEFEISRARWSVHTKSDV